MAGLFGSLDRNLVQTKAYSRSRPTRQPMYPEIDTPFCLVLLAPFHRAPNVVVILGAADRKTRSQKIMTPITYGAFPHGLDALTMPLRSASASAGQLTWIVPHHSLEGSSGRRSLHLGVELLDNWAEMRSHGS
jgi:hypothetical protein